MMPTNSTHVPNSDGYAVSEDLAKQNISESTTAENSQNLNMAVSQTSGFKRWQRSLHLVAGENQTQASPTPTTANEVSDSDTNAEDVSRYLRETLETLAY